MLSVANIKELIGIKYEEKYAQVPRNKILPSRRIVLSIGIHFLVRSIIFCIIRIV